jgi:tetratricopeptide (TPR) repeat protein
LLELNLNRNTVKQFNTILILCCVAVLTVSAAADQAETLFALANKAYAEGKYQQAVEFYEQILQKKLASGEVYFNLGNAYYKLNQTGKAILYYEKAEVYLSGDEALEQNLKIARLKIVDKIEPLPVLFLMEWWNAAINFFAYSTIAWLCFAFFTLTLIWLAIYLLVNRRIFIRLTWITAAVFVVLLVMFIGKIYQFESSQYGIIFADKISVVGEPTLTGQELFILHEGTKVKINRSLDGWYEISLADGKTGWIKADGLGII